MEPNAFFMTCDPATGEITYTRNGHFHRGEREDGFYLTTEDGKLVLDQNRQPLKLEVTDVEKLQDNQSQKTMTTIQMTQTAQRMILTFLR